MHTPPRKQYNGIQIILDKPSRFDLKSNYLLSGQPEQWLEDEVFSPDYSLYGCDIKTVDEVLSFLPGTKHLLLLGKVSAAKYQLDTARHGYPARIFNIPTVVAFNPQDCCDHRNIENADSDDDDDESVSDRDTKDSSPTRRSNYRFWTKWHIRKALYTKLPPLPKIILHAYPNLDKTYQLFKDITNENLYLDIETSRIHRCLSCVGITTDSLWPQVYVLPAYLYNGEFAYSNWQLWWKTITIAMLQNRPVIHNAPFDLFILRAFYKIPFPILTPYCTLRANHRCFPEVEKSLAHVMAQWTNLPYHKDVATEVFNRTMQAKMWAYNGNDVYALKPIFDAQMAYANGHKGLVESIEESNQQLIPYMENSMLGLRLDQYKLATTHNDLMTAQSCYERIIRMLLNKPTFNPNSSLQCRKYFHDFLNYPVIKRSDKPPYNPKLGKKELYQLLIKTGNPAIKAILRYRKVAKDASLLESETWTPE